MDAKFYIKNLNNSSNKNIEDAGEIEITEPGIVEAQEGKGFTKIDTTSLIQDAGELDIYNAKPIVIPDGKGYSKINLKLNKLPENANVVIYMKATSSIEDLNLDEDLLISFGVDCKLYAIKSQGNYLSTPSEITSFDDFVRLVNEGNAYDGNAFLVYGSTYEYEDINQIKDLLAIPLRTYDSNRTIEAFGEDSNVSFRFHLGGDINYADGAVGYSGF